MPMPHPPRTSQTRTERMPRTASPHRAFRPGLIAPCGLNCRLCRAYDRPRNPCPGCRKEDAGKPKACVRCPIKNCGHLKARHRRFCIACTEFPCHLIRRLDKRYRLTYGVSPIANLERVKSIGIRKFAASETSKWLCPDCGVFLCMHESTCGSCGYTWRTPKPNALRDTGAISRHR